MTPPGLLPIGTFARAAGLTVTALRHYHELELLVPAMVDDASGYRYYSTAQLVDAEIIRQLRGLDVPVPDVQRVLAARTEAVTAQVLTEHRRRMADRVAKAQAAVRELQELMNQPLRLLGERVELVRIEDLPVLGRTATLGAGDLGGFFAEAYPELVEEAIREGLQPCGPAGAVYPGTDWDPAGFEVTAFVPVTGEARPPRWTTLPGGRFACTTHVGPHERIGDSYRGIGAWLAQGSFTTGDRIRENYLAGPGDCEPQDYRTQILWPLETGNAQAE